MCTVTAPYPLVVSDMGSVCLGRSQSRSRAFIHLLFALVPAAIRAQVRLNDAQVLPLSCSIQLTCRGLREGMGEVNAWIAHQVVGTHNSYHLPPPDAIQNLAWNPDVDTLAADYAQAAVNTSQYSHMDLYKQLDLGKLHC